jgi:hypothetical protein
MCWDIRHGNSYGISGCRVNDLKHLTIKLNPALRNKLIQYPTLLQFMYSVLWEITFFGGPSQRDEKMEEIVESVKDGNISDATYTPRNHKKVWASLC